MMSIETINQDRNELSQTVEVPVIAPVPTDPKLINRRDFLEVFTTGLAISATILFFDMDFMEKNDDGRELKFSQPHNDTSLREFSIQTVDGVGVADGIEKEGEGTPYNDAGVRAWLWIKKLAVLASWTSLLPSLKHLSSTEEAEVSSILLLPDLENDKLAET